MDPLNLVRHPQNLVRGPQNLVRDPQNLVHDPQNLVQKTQTQPPNPPNPTPQTPKPKGMGAPEHSFANENSLVLCSFKQLGFTKRVGYTKRGLNPTNMSSFTQTFSIWCLCIALLYTIRQQFWVRSFCFFCVWGWVTLREWVTLSEWVRPTKLQPLRTLGLAPKPTLI